MKNLTLARWKVVFAGFLLALMGGVSYSWGVLVIPLMEEYGWIMTEATLPFTVFLVVFSLTMIPAGWLVDKKGPRRIAAIGAIIFFLSYSLSALVVHFPHHWWLMMTYGVIGGIGCGLTYACVAPPARKWFPDNPGLAVSFAVMGFGLSALIAAPIKTNYLLRFHGIEGTFFILGVVTSVVSLVGAALIGNPPPDWSPKDGEKGKKIRETIRIRNEMTPKEVIRNSMFWILWAAFALVAAGSLASLGLIPTYGQRVVNLTPVESALAISILAGFNGFGRPIAGFLGDRFGSTRIMAITYGIQMITLFSLPYVVHSKIMLYISSAFVGWGLAVTLALFPALTSLSFGTRNLGSNYGLVFTAFGAGAIASSTGAWLFHVSGSFYPIFLTTGLMAGFSLVLCVILRRKYQLP
jgi:OFA family oxalate/formate antiporter-like MFS transporter